MRRGSTGIAGIPDITAITATAVRCAITFFFFGAASVSAQGRVTSAAKDSAPARAVVPVDRPAHVRGLYLNAWAAGSTRKLAKLLDIADHSEINAFVIDVKEGGEISYISHIPLAKAIGSGKPYIRDPRALLEKLKQHNIYPIARIVAFKDGTLAGARPQWSIRKADGSPWQDRNGKTWVDSFNKDVWDYNVAIAKEALDLGFAEVQWDYVRFPDVPTSMMKTAVFPAKNGRSMQDGIRQFLLYSREKLASYHAPITADVFGLTVSVGNDLGIGQRWEKMSDAVDVLLPMVYPSHFVRGSYGIPYPNAAPYTTVRKAMDSAVKRSKPIEHAARIRPWLQDFSLGSPRYTAPYVRAQIQATYDAGLEEWVLWNPGSNYTVGALATKEGVPPALALPDTATLHH